MKTINKHKGLKQITVITLVWMLLFNGLEVHASRDIFIRTPQDLLQLASNCGVDAYSKDRQVHLLNDLDMTGLMFEGIPTFGGTFLGNDHSISGIRINGRGSNQGFFRYIQKDGVVKNLHVIGEVATTGSQSRLGGIVGVNHGMIKGSSFAGHVEGSERIGGIAGVNDRTGKILDSQAKGSVSGEQFTGGIAGENLGYIQKATNGCEVNTTAKATEFDIEDINMGEMNSRDTVLSYTDIGGITGHNKGIIEYSVNEGKIGYPHVGYNVAGIAGRQDGFMRGCINKGFVQGRKDVGGIVGQMEPDVETLYAKDFFDELDVELEGLQGDINKALDDTDRANVAVKRDFDALNDALNEASDKMEILMNQSTDYADETVDEVNEAMARVDKLMDDLALILGTVGEASAQMTEGFEDLEAAFKDLDEATDYAGAAGQDSAKALEDAQNALKELESAMKRLDGATAYFRKALENNDKVDEAFGKMIEALELRGQATQDFSEALANLLTSYNNRVPGRPVFDDDDIQKLGQAGVKMGEATLKMAEALSLLRQEINNDVPLINQGFQQMSIALGHLTEGIRDLQDSTAHLTDSMKKFEKAMAETGEAMEDFSAGMAHFEKASGHMTVALELLEGSLAYQRNLEDIHFPSLGDYTDEASGAFFDALDTVSEKMAALSDSTSASSTTLTEDFRRINNRFFGIIDIIKEARESFEARREKLYEDVSEAGIDEGALGFYPKTIEPVSGYVVLCDNYGAIEGDINVGGIAGAMAVEVALDPESDLTALGDSSIRLQFKAKSVLANSRNEGSVTSKKDYAGGIVGRADLGSVMNSESYGLVESTDGSYVGGIAGGSYSVVRNSYVMTKLKGQDYVGGIAGYGTELFDNKAMVALILNNDINHERIGSIAGDVDREEGTMEKNYFVDRDGYGVDGISYETMAMPMSYEEMVAGEAIPDVFKNLTLTFKAEGVREVYTFAYGGAIPLSDLPEIPEKEGYFAQWPAYNYDKLLFSDVIEAEYTKLVETLASEGEGPAKVLVEGLFTPESALKITDLEQTTHLPLAAGDMSSKEVVGQWALSIEGKEEDGQERLFRLKVEAPATTEIYIEKEGQWEKVTGEVEGSYVLFHATGNLVKVMALGKIQVTPYRYIALGASTVLLLMGVIFRNKKKKAANAKMEEEKA